MQRKGVYTDWLPIQILICVYIVYLENNLSRRIEVSEISEVTRLDEHF